MAFDFKAALKHKWVKVALGFVAVLGVILIVKSRSSASNAASGTVVQAGPTDAEVQADAALQEQQNAIAANSASQSASIAAQAAQQQESDQTGLAAQKESDSTSLSLAGIQLQALEDQFNAQTTQNSDTLNAQVSLANINAGEQENLAQTTANEQMGLANVQASVANHQSDNALTALQSNNATALQTTQSNNQVAVTNSNNQAQVAITQSNNAGSDGCFITTAVCENAGLPDDCEQLETLRTFRDSYMLATPDREWLVNLYYTVAPLIVDRIDAFAPEARDEAYRILRVYIAAALAAVKAGDNARAERIYRAMVARASEIAQ
jgi:hypothetical protein